MGRMLPRIVGTLAFVLAVEGGIVANMTDGEVEDAGDTAEEESFMQSVLAATEFEIPVLLLVPGNDAMIIMSVPRDSKVSYLEAAFGHLCVEPLDLVFQQHGHELELDQDVSSLDLSKATRSGRAIQMQARTSNPSNAQGSGRRLQSVNASTGAGRSLTACAEQHHPFQLLHSTGRHTLAMWSIGATEGGHVTCDCPFAPGSLAEWYARPVNVCTCYYTSRAGTWLGTDTVTFKYRIVERSLNQRRRRRVNAWWDYWYVEPTFQQAICVTDTNECEPNYPGICEQVCYNTIGSYDCDCHHEHYRNQDGRTCTSCKCPPGFERLACSAPLSPCLACTPGRSKVGDGMGPCEACVPCSPGYELINCSADNAGSCEQCPSGKFKPDVGQWNSLCIECAPCESASHVRVNCSGTSEGVCAALSLATPSCELDACTEWWAGQPTQIRLSSTAPLCTDGRCSSISLELRRRAGGVEELVEELASISANVSSTDYVWDYLPSEAMLAGYGYFLAITVAAPDGVSTMSGFMRGDDFLVRSLAEWYDAQLLVAAGLSDDGEDALALSVVEALCYWRNDSHAFSMKAAALQNVSCARADTLRNGGSFFGLEPNEVPALHASSLQGYSTAAASKLQMLHVLEEQEKHHQVLNAWYNLQARQRSGEEVSVQVLRQEMRRLALVDFNRSEALRRSSLQREVEGKDLSIRQAAAQIRADLQQRLKLSEHVAQGLQEIGFYGENFIDRAERRIDELKVALDRAIAEYRAALKKQRKRWKLIGTIAGALKVVIGVGMMFFGQPAGAALVAQGLTDVVSAHIEKDSVDVIGFWPSHKDTQRFNETLDDLPEWAVALGANYMGDFAVGAMQAIDFSEKDLKRVSSISSFVDKAEAFIVELEVDAVPAPDIQHFQVQIAEQRKMIIQLRGMIESVHVASSAEQILDVHLNSIMEGISPPVHFAARVKTDMAVTALEHWLDQLQDKSPLGHEEVIKLKMQERRLIVAIRGALELDVAENSRRLSAMMRERLWLVEELAEVDRRAEEFRQEMLHDGALDVQSAAQGHFLVARAQPDRFFRASLVTDIQELLSKQNLAVAYLCLDVAAPALGLRGARDYLSLQSLQAGLEQRIVDCLETRASQQAHTAPHSFDIPLLHNATFEPLVSEGSLRVCIPPPSISANGSFYVDGRVENVAVYLLGIRQRHTVSMFVERSGPIVIVTPEGELASFTVDLRQWLFQYETGMCRPITSPEKSCQQNDFSRVSAYGCWKVTVLEFDSLPLEEVTGLRFVFDISARVKVNVSSKAAMVMFPDMNEQRAMRAAQCF